MEQQRVSTRSGFSPKEIGRYRGPSFTKRRLFKVRGHRPRTTGTSLWRLPPVAEHAVQVAEGNVKAAEDAVSVAGSEVSVAEEAVSVATGTVSVAESPVSVAEGSVFVARSEVSVAGSEVSVATGTVSVAVSDVTPGKRTVNAAYGTVALAGSLGVPKLTRVCSQAGILTELFREKTHHPPPAPRRPVLAPPPARPGNDRDA